MKSQHLATMASFYRSLLLSLPLLLSASLVGFSSALTTPSLPNHRQPPQRHSKDTSTSGTISIHRIPSTSSSSSSQAVDLLEALADLRYQEWMMDEPPERRPSVMAFRSATAEIQQERMDDQAIPFLAHWNEGTDHDSSSSTAEVVGSAELSPIEFNGCFDLGATAAASTTTATTTLLASSNNTNISTYNHNQYWYITDVVTARTHRRKGIASELMKALECHASEVLLSSLASTTPSASATTTTATTTTTTTTNTSTVLLLHVEPDNEGALKFYQRLGYDLLGKPDAVDYLTGVDTDKLAENTGVSGQLLLGKQLYRAAV